MVQGHGSRSVPRVALVAVLALSVTLVLGSGRARSATPLCTPDPTWGGVDAAATAELLGLVTQHRLALGLPSLQASPTLTDAAVWKSQHMAYFAYLGHDDPAPPRSRTSEQRVAECGYPSRAAENLAYYGSATQTMQQWLLSAGHRDNIENATARAIGIAATQAANGSYYWVLLLGTTIDADPLDPSITETPVETPDGSPTVVPVPEPSSTDGAETPAPDPTSTDGTSGPQNPATDEPAVANSTPDVHGEFVRTAPRRWVEIRVLKNDSDVDGDTLRVKKIARRPSKGRAVIADSGKFIRYRARAGTSGRDRFTYVVSDGNGGTARATVTIRLRT